MNSEQLAERMREFEQANGPIITMDIITRGIEPPVFSIPEHKRESVPVTARQRKERGPTKYSLILAELKTDPSPSGKAIAKRIGVTEVYVRKVAAEHNFKLIDKRVSPRRQRIIDYLAANTGKTRREIADACKAHFMLIEDVAKTVGYELMKSKLKERTKTEIVLEISGPHISDLEVAAIAGCSDAHVRKVCILANIKLGPRKPKEER